MEVQKQLQLIRTIIKKAAPDAVEQIVYGMPGYKTNGKPLVYFAGYKNHIGTRGISKRAFKIQTRKGFRTVSFEPDYSF